MMYRLFLLFLLVWVTSSFHPFHVGVTEMRYNEASERTEISVRLFINDLEKIIKQNYGQQLDFYKTTDKDIATVEILNKYLQKNLVLNLDTQIVPYTILGFEREDDALWIHMESNESVRPTQVEIFNALLYDLFNDQANIHHFQVGNERKSYKALCPNTQIKFSYH